MNYGNWQAPNNKMFIFYSECKHKKWNQYPPGNVRYEFFYTISKHNFEMFPGQKQTMTKSSTDTFQHIRLKCQNTSKKALSNFSASNYISIKHCIKSGYKFS
jgi:hypothetical protein